MGLLKKKNLSFFFNPGFKSGGRPFYYKQYTVKFHLEPAKFRENVPPISIR